MNYSIFLGPNVRYVPESMWDQYKARGELTLYDLVFKRLGTDGWYKPVLVHDRVEIALGQVFPAARRRGEWACIPNPSLLSKATDSTGRQTAVRRYSQQGFASRLRAAEYLMRVQEFTDPLEW